MSNYHKKKIIASVAPYLSTFQVHRLFQPFYSGLGQILMFHRVIPDSSKLRIHNHQSLEISPTQLEETILYYKKKGYQFLSFDQFYDGIQNKTLSKKFVVLTFDDGYRDNYTIAYPILKKHSVPFTIYITTNFPDRKAILWWYILEDMIRDRTSISFSWKGDQQDISLRTEEEKELGFDKIRNFINQNFDKDHYQEMLLAIFGDYQSDLFAYAHSHAMSWSEIQKISEDPLVTIGAHTVNHFPLKQLKDKELVPEIMDSKTLLEKNIGQAVEHFAYPFGKAAEASFREFEAIKKLGFKTATTTRMGNIFPDHSQHLECLPRININRVSNTDVLQLQTSGMLPFILHKGKKLITH